MLTVNNEYDVGIVSGSVRFILDPVRLETVPTDNLQNCEERIMERRIVKKIIAREGLIILGIAVGGGIILIPLALISAFFFQRNNPAIDDFIQSFSLSLWVSMYPIYVLVRFIGWAVRTLKE